VSFARSLPLNFDSIKMKSFDLLANKKSYKLWLWALAVLIVGLAYFVGSRLLHTDAPEGRVDTTQIPDKDYVELNEKQLSTIKVSPAKTADFVATYNAYGNVGFNENSAVQVFTNYQGRVIQTFADVGDVVKKGQVLFSVDSADLAQAESTLLAAKGVYAQTTATLARATELYETKAISLKEYQQNVADQNTAEGALKAARLTVALFGKSDAEIAQIELKRQIDSTLKVLSPLSGSVITRNVQPGLLVQPGSTPAPFVVADVSTKWLIINATEAESPRFKAGQEVEVKVTAFPTETFKGRIKVVGSVVDPVTRTVTVRSEISDASNRLRSGMYATFTVRSDKVINSVAVPDEALVREGDGTMSVWVAESDKRMKKRTVTTGLRTNGMVQITQGLKEGELIATTGSIFLSNLLVVGE